MKHSVYQNLIFNFVKYSEANAVVEAVAGSGKTTTAVHAMRHVPSYMNILFAAFNKSIVEELERRVPEGVTVKTMHSIGWSAMKRHYGGDIQLLERKSFSHAEKLFYKMRREKWYWGYLHNIIKLADIVRQNVEFDEQTVDEAMEKHAISILTGEEPLHVMQLIKSMCSDLEVFDFTDMIFFPARNQEIRMPKFDFVFIDELQDLNRAQQVMIERMFNKKSRFIGLGDSHQCQPEGSKIMLGDGSEIEMQYLQNGDSLATFDLRTRTLVGGNSKSVGKKIEQVAKRKYNGDLIVVESVGKRSRFTPNHRCIVKFDAETVTKETTCVYLMQSGDKFRIGKTKIMNYDESAMQFRFRSEKAERMWILDIFDDDHDASFFEQLWSYQFGIPQLCWYPSNTNKNFDTKEKFDLFYEYLSPWLFPRGLECLKFFGRSFELPFLEKDNKRRVSTSGQFECYAQNMFDKYMKVAHISIGDVEWKQVNKVTREHYEGYVYSLKVEKYETYFSEGVLTHNSIYGFRGSDEQSFARFRQMPNTSGLPLSICYRCGKAIVEEAKLIVPQIQWYPFQEDGKVRTGTVDEITGGDWVICRNTKPLVILAFVLISDGKKAKIKGKEIGDNIIALLQSTGVNMQSVAVRILKSKRDQLLLQYRDHYKMEKPELHPKVISLEENIGVIEFLFDKMGGDVRRVIKFLQETFSDDHADIMLSTIHKAKGLENDRVFFLRPDLIPSRYAVNDWQKEQEENLKYVAITRAKKELVYVHDFPYEQLSKMILNT